MAPSNHEGRAGRRLLVGLDLLGNQYVLVCFDDGGYAIARNGVLMGDRSWDWRGAGPCVTEFLRLTGQAAQYGVGGAAAAGS